MSEYIARLRPQLRPTFPYITHKGINNGSQSFIMWRNRQHADHRMSFNRSALHVASDDPASMLAEKQRRAKERREMEKAKEFRNREIEQELRILKDDLRRQVEGKKITEYQSQKAYDATAREKAKELADFETEPEIDPNLFIPAKQPLRGRHIDAFQEFCAVFPVFG